MDTVAGNGGSVAIGRPRQNVRSMRSSKSRFEKPKKLIDSLVNRTPSKKLADGVQQGYTEQMKEFNTFFAFFKPENKDKNAKQDIFLYDSTRVVLTDGPDYYHASNVDGFSRQGQYVLAQAPFNKDVQVDFFRLVQQTKPDAVVLMDKPESEEGKLVLPGKESKFGNITVKSEEESKGADVSVFTLTVGKHKTKVYTMNMWPSDKEFSKEFPKELIDCHVKIRKSITWENKEKILVTCRDGAARSGIFAFVDIESERLKTKQRVKVNETLKNIRAQRSHCFDTPEIFDAALKSVLELCKRAT